VAREEARNLGDPLRSCGNASMQTERTIHRNAEALMGVGLAGSTLSVGKPHAWGSGEAKEGLR
jgi:hypothetical protein